MSDVEMGEREAEGERTEAENSSGDEGVQLKKRGGPKKKIVAKDSDEESDDGGMQVDKESGNVEEGGNAKEKEVEEGEEGNDAAGSRGGSPRPESGQKKRKKILRRDSDSDDSGGEGDKENEEPAAEEGEGEGGEGNNEEEQKVSDKEARRREFEEMALKRKQAQEQEMAANEKGDEKEGGGDEEEGRVGKKKKKSKDRKRERKDKKRSREEKRKEKNKEKKNKAKDKEKSKKARVPRKTEEELEEERVKALISRHLSYVVGKGVLESDAGLTKKSCKKALAAIFGEETVEDSKTFISEGIVRIIAECQELMQGDKLQEFLDSNPPVAAHEALSVKKLLIQQLDTILYKAFVSGKIQTLTRRGCRDQLAAVFGSECVEAHREVVDPAVVIRMNEIAAMDEEEREEAAEARVSITSEDVEGRKDLVPSAAGEDGDDGEEEAQPSGESESDVQDSSDGGAESSDVQASSDADSDDSLADMRRKKKSKGGKAARKGGSSASKKKLGPLGDMIFVFTGKKLSDPESSRVVKLTLLIEKNGGKVQRSVTARVTHVVVAKSQGSIPSSDSRIRSAKKFGSKVVYDSFVEAAVEGGASGPPIAADHAVDVTGGGGGGGSSSKAARRDDEDEDQADGSDDDDDDERAPGSASKKSKKQMRREELEDLLDDGGAMSGEEGGGRKRRVRAPAARKTDAEKQFAKEHQDRFGWLKDARRRTFDPKDVVVPDATMYNDPDGTIYNTYMTLAVDDDSSDEESADKFYSIKMLNAGGMMAGDKWHVVYQHGRVGTQKPGCEVQDFFDLGEAKAHYGKVFWDKTRNSWESGLACFRAVSGRYMVVEISDGDSDVEEGDESRWGIGSTSQEGEEEGGVITSLPAAVRDLLELSMSRTEIANVATALGLSGPNALYKIKRHHVQMGLAELCGAQQVLSKGDKATQKDNERMRSHQARFAQLFPQDTAEGEAGEAARKEGVYLGSVNAIKEKGRILDATGEVCVSMAMRRRAANAPDTSVHFADRFYKELRTRLFPLPKESANYALIQRMLTNTGPAQDAPFTLRLDSVLSVTRAGEGGRFAAFSRLPNKMLLWKGIPSTSVPSILAQGFRVPPAEAPSLMHMFGKGIYFSSSAAVASRDCSLTEASPSGVIAICEVALGEQHSVTRPSIMRRAPHGTHSVYGKGKESHPSEGVAEVSGERGVSAVVMPPAVAHGTPESSFQNDQYVVYDQGQVRMRYIARVSAVFGGGGAQPMQQASV